MGRVKIDTITEVLVIGSLIFGVLDFDLLKILKKHALKLILAINLAVDVAVPAYLFSQQSPQLIQSAPILMEGQTGTLIYIGILVIASCIGFIISYGLHRFTK